MSADLEALAKLREPFPPEAISKLPKGKEDKAKRQRCNVCKGFHDPSMFHLDYVGHAALTDRLLTVDPLWNWEPFATDDHGAPLMERDNGRPIGLWIRLTVAGMTRPGYGSVEAGKPEAVKELIGDALRNAGMRFGMALELWHKGDLPTEEPEMDGREPDPVPTVDTSRLEDLLSQAAEAGLDVDRDKSLEYARRSKANCDVATDKLAGRLAEHRKAKLEDDSSGGGQDGREGEALSDPPPPEGTNTQEGGVAEPSDTGKGQPAAESSAGTGAGEGGHDQRRESTSSPDTSPDEPYDVLAHCNEVGVPWSKVIGRVIQEWPNNDQFKRPKPRRGDLVDLVEKRPEMVTVVRGIVDDLAGEDG